MPNQYRFLTKDEFGKPCHRHQILINGEWKDATGGSSIVSVLEKGGLTWWAAGLAVKEFSGIENPKLLTKIKHGKALKEEIKQVQDWVKEWKEKHRDMTLDEYIDLCGDAYKAHTVKLTASAEEGTELHLQLSNYVLDCIKNNNGVPL